MANFAESHHLVEELEGGYVNDPDDRGGETFMGISRRHHPSWAGWSLLDSGTNKDELRPLAAQLYRREYWQPLLLDQFPSQRLATLVYQAAVNCGTKRAAYWLQAAINAVHEPDIQKDGRIGNHTLQALQECLNEGLAFPVIEWFRTQQKQHYLDLAAADPSQKKFLKGWLKRIESV